MIAQQVTGQSSTISGSMLTMSRQGSTTSHVSYSIKDNIVNLFSSMHENSPPKVWSVSNMGDNDQSPFGTNDNLHTPLLLDQGSVFYQFNYNNNNYIQDMPPNTHIIVTIILQGRR
jgi:hypothetical protein